MAYAAIAFLTQGVPYLNRIAAAERNGRLANANLFVDGPFTKDYAASAVLELPPVPPQKDSPSVQIGFWGPYGVVQGGLMRAPDDNFRLRAFAAFPWGRRQNVKYLGRLNDGPHSFQMRTLNGKVTFSVDGHRRLILFPRTTYLPLNSNPFLIVGTAVRYYGSTASGTISDLRVQRDGDARLISFQPVCVVSNGGIHLVQDGTRWVLGGSYEPSVPTTYEHCRAVFARQRARFSTLKKPVSWQGPLR